jgi:hypothetical protein
LTANRLDPSASPQNDELSRIFFQSVRKALLAIASGGSLPGQQAGVDPGEAVPAPRINWRSFPGLEPRFDTK